MHVSYYFERADLLADREISSRNIGRICKVFNLSRIIEFFVAIRNADLVDGILSSPLSCRATLRL